MLLSEHLFETGERSLELVKKLTENTRFHSLAFISGLFHDLGKARYQCQQHLKNDEKIDINHGVASAALFEKYVECKGIEESEYNFLLRTIIFHHPITENKSFEYDGYLRDFEEENIKDLISILVDKYNETMVNSNIKLSMKEDVEDYVSVSKYNEYFSKDTKENGNLFILTSVLRFADIMSSDKNITFESICNREFTGDVTIEKPSYYDDRFYVQKDYAKKLHNYNVSMFDSQTSFGKTMLGIMYLLSNKKKGYWVCPRNTIAEGLYETICKELKVLNLDKIISVSLLLGGEFKEGEKKGEADIIVTNIDNFVRPQIKSDSKTNEANANIRVYNMLYCNCIFDEYHEYIGDDAILAMYLSVMEARKKCKDSKTLLLSATAIEPLYNRFIDAPEAAMEYKCENILSRKVIIHFAEPDTDLKGKNFFYSVNTVATCQNVYLCGITDNVIHARYTDNDRANKYKKIYAEHGKGVEHHTSWVGNNVISTGIDISFGNMAVSYPTPEKFIQSLGRCNRWNECVETPHIYIYMNTSDKSEKKGADIVSSSIIAEKFYHHLNTNLVDGAEITLGDLYNCRKSFYELPIIKGDVFRKYFNSCRNDSIENMMKINYQYSNDTNKKEDEVVRISNKASLRKTGDIMNFFASFQYNGNPDNWTEPIQVDNVIINFNLINNDSSVEKMLKRQWHNGKINSKKHFDNLMKNKSKAFSSLMSKAIASDNPLPIMTTYFYNSNIGIYKDR